MSANAAHFDDNQVPTMMGAIGTLGTADAGGTAKSLPIGVNPATGAMYVEDLSGASGTTNVLVVGGTLNAGTVTATAVLDTGTITTIVAGTQNTLGTVGAVNNIVTGTLATAGTVTGVGVVSNLTNGSVVMTIGTLTTGSISNVAMMNAGTFVQASGTTTLVSTVTTVSNLTNGSVNILTGTLQSSGTTTGVGVVSNLTNGSINLLTGTVTSVTNLAAGTVQINPVPVPTVLALGTLGTAGGSFFATISAASGAGTRHFISGVDVVMQSGTADVRVLAGTVIQGTGVLAAGQFPAGGGISKGFNPAFATGTNSELTYHFVGAGSAFITVNYWRGV